MKLARIVFSDVDGDQLSIGEGSTDAEAILTTSTDGFLVTREGAPALVRAILESVGLEVEDL